MEHETQAIQSLITRCRNGEPGAARELYEKYAKAMYHICLRMMNNVHDAEDMLQEAFCQVFKNLDSFRGESTLGAWIKRIVVNKCLNQLKRKVPLWVDAEAEQLEQAEEEPLDEHHYTYTVEKVKEAIRRLPDGYRVVLSLYLFDGYSHRQIADSLGITESTAKTQYLRAKRKVRAFIGEDPAALRPPIS